MRMLNRNKQELYYALYLGEEPVYELDENGEKIVEYIDTEGNVYYLESGYSKAVYGNIGCFLGNITTSGGKLTDSEFGLDTSDYEAVLMVDKGLLPIDETSLIWQDSKPEVGIDGYVDGNTADYRIVKLSPSLNIDKYVLKRNIK